MPQLLAPQLLAPQLLVPHSPLAGLGGWLDAELAASKASQLLFPEASSVCSLSWLAGPGFNAAPLERLDRLLIFG